MNSSGRQSCWKVSSEKYKVRKGDASHFAGTLYQSNVGDVSPNVLGAFCSDSGKHGDFNHSSGRNGNDQRFMAARVVPQMTTRSVGTAALVKLPMVVRISLFSVSLLFTAMGEGVQKHTIFIFGYDQFRYQMDDEEKAKRQAYIWWGVGRFVGTANALIASSLLVEFLRTESMTWWVFGGILSSRLTFLPSIIYLLGRLSFHRAKIASKSPHSRALKVIVAAIRKQNLPYVTDACFIYGEER